MKVTRDQAVRQILLGVAIIAMVLLIAGVSQIELAPGLPFEQIWAFLIGDFTGIPRGPVQGIDSPLGQWIVDAVRVIFFIALMAFPFAVILVIVDPEARKRVLRAMLRLAILAALLSLFVQNQTQEPLPPEEPQGQQQQPQEEMGPIPSLTDEEFNPSTVSPALVWGTSLGIGVLIAIIVIVIINQIRKSQAEEETPLEEIARRARTAIDEIQRGGDLRNTILRCYAEMSRVVREERGVRRDSGVTAREFTDYLVKANLPDKPVNQLTRLFEKARYGSTTPTPSDEQEAVASLQAIIDACLLAKAPAGTGEG